MSGQEFFPYIIEGQWYHIFLESDGTDITITNSDLPGCSINGTTLVLPKKFHALQIMHDMHTEGGSLSAAATMPALLKIYADGTQCVQLGSAKCADYADIYIYGHTVES